MEVNEAMELADWRRRVAAMYGRWRAASGDDAETATAALRAERADLFRHHPQSPLKPEARSSCGGLSHWDYDPAYRMTAVVELSIRPAREAAPGLLALPSSGAEPSRFQLIGSVRLSGPLAGTMLPVFWMEGYAGGLFVPFRDATAGRETYGAGRYLLDTVKGADQGGDPASGELVLDFNVAYHPSCAYDPRWTCPLAPPESRLAVPVEAGERLA
ncbi:DUF1684 domain-containing protein [soil metagenome]